jgi:hypothetical protein
MELLPGVLEDPLCKDELPTLIVWDRVSISVALLRLPWNLEFSAPTKI